nr:hypothetical protein [Thalassospira sp. HJ]
MPLFIHRVMQDTNNEDVITFNEVINHMTVVMVATHAGMQKTDIPPYVWRMGKGVQAVA